MFLPVRSFQDIVQDMAAAIESTTAATLDLSVGSILRALIEANAAVVQWAQWLALLTLQTVRAATCSGSDLDSWMADFSLTRLPATPSSGFVTFSRYAPVTQAVIPVGASVRTSDGLNEFKVSQDETNSSWNAERIGYILSSGVSSIVLPVVATNPGSGSNLTSGQLVRLSSAIPGVDTVTNTEATIGGKDSEEDDAFRSRFSLYFNSRNRATADAIAYAISQVDPNLPHLILENTDSDLSPRIGSILIVVNAVNGNLTEWLQQALFQAIDPVRPIGTFFAIRQATNVSVVPGMQLSLRVGAARDDIEAKIRNALEIYIQSLPIGATLSVTRLVQLVYNTSNLIENISGLSINAQSNDLSCSQVEALSFSDVVFS